LLAASAEQRVGGRHREHLDSRYEPGRRSGAWIKIKTWLGKVDHPQVRAPRRRYRTIQINAPAEY